MTQQKVNFVDSRLRSAEHSSELDALHSLAREFAPQGVARELSTQQSCDCLTHIVRLFDAHSAIIYAPRAPMRMGDGVDKSSVFIWFLA